MRDMPYIDALIAGFCTSCDEPSAVDQAMAFDTSLEKSGWTIVPIDKIETDAKVIAALREALNPDRLADIIGSRWMGHPGAATNRHKTS